MPNIPYIRWYLLFYFTVQLFPLSMLPKEINIIINILYTKSVEEMMNRMKKIVLLFFR